MTAAPADTRLLTDPQHGVGGWQLVAYDFDEETGAARCQYEHAKLGLHEVVRDRWVSREYHERVRDERRRSERRDRRPDDQEGRR